MNEEVDLIINQFMAPFCPFHSVYGQFDDYYKAMLYVKEIKKTLRVFSIDLKSEHWHITYYTTDSPDERRGKLSFEIATGDINIAQIAYLMDAIEREMESDEYNET